MRLSLFSILFCFLSGHAVLAQTVTMTPHQGQTTAPSDAWQITVSTGAAVNTAGTMTQGLQEAINFACANGFSLHADGGSANYNGPYINATAEISILCPQITTISIQNTTINVGGVGILDCLHIDSMMASSFTLKGQLVCEGSGGAAVRVAPVHSLPGDTQIVVTDSFVHIDAIALVGTAQEDGVVFDLSSGSVLGARFEFGEINGAGGVGAAPHGRWGIAVVNPQSTTVFQKNMISAVDDHDFTTGVQEGTNQTNQANLRGNIWSISGMNVAGSGFDTGFNTYGSHDTIMLGMIGGTIGAGYWLEPGSAGNAIVGGYVASGQAIGDYGTGNVRFTAW